MSIHSCLRGIGALPLLLASAAAAGAAPAAAPAKSTLPVPLSSYFSPEARAAFDKLATTPPQPDFHGDVAALRRWNAVQEEERLREARKRYAVKVRRTELGGVRIDIVLPATGVAPRNRGRVLISLHGGGFMWGAGAGALSEAVPVAARGRIEVISVDYRMAPESKFPAASEDVAAVYRALLAHYRSDNIGLYGCSAGGILAAQAVAWFAAHGLPRPGAIASECGTGAELEGDSGYVAGLLVGQPIPPGGKPLHLVDLPYFQGIDPKDPLVFPIVSPAVLANFPPTLLLAGSRDFAASSLTTMHRRLHAAGVESELYLFDGLPHAFMMDPTLPESAEADDILCDFFARYLGRDGRRSRR